MAYDPHYDKVVLLCQFDGANNSTTMTDEKGHPLTAYGNAKLSTTRSRFGGSSLSLEPNNSIEPSIRAYVTGDAHSTDFDQDGAVDFCIEAWIYVESNISPTWGRVVGCGGVGGASAAVNWGLDISGNGKMRLEWGKSDTVRYNDEFFSANVPKDAWTFIKISVEGTAIRAWIDGVSKGTKTINNTTTPRVSVSTDRIEIGLNPNQSPDFRCYIDSLRVTFNEARVSDTAVPTAPFPTAAPPTIYGDIPITVTMTSEMSQFNSHTLHGDIPITVTMTSTMTGPASYSITGDIPITVAMNSTMTALPLQIRTMTGQIPIRPTLFSAMRKVLTVPPGWVRRQFICELTGSPDIALPINSFNADLSVSGLSHLSAVIHNANDALISAIEAHADGDIVVKRSHDYADGSRVEREFIRVGFNPPYSSDTGPKAGVTLTLRGERAIPATSFKSVPVLDVMKYALSGGAARYTAAINDDLALGDTAIINGDQLIVGKLSYTVNPKAEMMELVEYTGDGLDMPNAIGSNARLKPLQAFQVTHINANYDLWREDALRYNGLTLSNQAVNQSYSLYVDSEGLLWFMDGFEGIANIPVFLTGGVVQARVNLQ